VVGCIELLINKEGFGFYGAVFSCITLLLLLYLASALPKIMMAQEPLSFILSPQY
jgi:hypothetical protein